MLWISCSVSFGQQFIIEGTIVDPSGQTVPSVNINILNSHLQTLSNDNGSFRIDPIQSGVYTLRFSSVGYATINKQVHIDKNTNIEIRLSRANHRLDEAIVTANKTEVDPQKIAGSVSVLDETAVRDHNIWNIKDISAFIPNLYSSNPGDNRNITSIRGITTSSYDPAVATYVDGVSQFNLDTYIPYLQDIERIEILRGPQGTLYGRNAMGGVINIITKRPTNAQSGTVELTAGNKGQQRYQLSFRSPLVQDKLFLGVAGLFNKADGFYTNEFDDSAYDRQHTTYGNAFLRYLINDKWDIHLNYKQVANRNRGAFPVVMESKNAFENPFKLNQNALTQMVDNSRNASLSVHYRGRTVDFSSQTAYQANQRYYRDPIDGDFSPLDGITVINNYGSDWNTVQAYTQELKVSSSAHNTSLFNWAAGMYLFHQDSPEKQGTYFGKDAGLMGVPITEATSILTNKSLKNGLAAFAQVGYRITDGLQISAGFRYDYEHVKHRGNEELLLADNNVQIMQPDTSGSASFSAFSPSLSLAYDLSDQNSLYSSYNRGFRTGGLTPISSEDPTASPLRLFKPEYSDNIEIGSKNTFLDHRIQLNASLFYTLVHDAQVPVFVMPDAITLTQNTGKMKSKGVELELNTRLTSTLDVYGNFAYTHARYTDMSRVDESENIILKGNRPIFTPDWTSMAGIKFTYPLAAQQSIQINAYTKFLGKQYFDLDNTIGQSSYALLNASIRYENRGYSITAWGQNLGDKKYIDYAYNFGAVHLGNPLTYGLTLYKSFAL